MIFLNHNMDLFQFLSSVGLTTAEKQRVTVFYSNCLIIFVVFLFLAINNF